MTEPLKSGQTIGFHPLAAVKPETAAPYGTHTLPKEFWGHDKGSIRADPDYQQRRKVKAERHIQNQAKRAVSK